jgi:hypothetical protein
LPSAKGFGLYGGYDLATPHPEGGYIANKFFGVPQHILEEMFPDCHGRDEEMPIISLLDSANIANAFTEDTLLRKFLVSTLNEIFPGRAIPESFEKNLLPTLQTIFTINRYMTDLSLDDTDDWENIVSSYEDEVSSILKQNASSHLGQKIKAIKTLLRSYEDAVQMNKYAYGNNEPDSKHPITNYNVCLVPTKLNENPQKTVERVAKLPVLPNVYITYAEPLVN